MPSSGGAPANPTMTDPPDPPAPLPQPPGEAARIGQQNEADLVARALAGDRAAFGTLVERYAATARRVARAVLGDPDDADDAAQDGMLSALLKLEQYDPRRPFGDRKSTRLNSSHSQISYAVFCLKKKKHKQTQ